MIDSVASNFPKSATIEIDTKKGPTAMQPGLPLWSAAHVPKREAASQIGKLKLPQVLYFE